LKISLNWLKEYVDLTGLQTKEIISKLTIAGLEVEDVFDESEIYKDFIVALVKEKQKHPNADRLSLCTVFDGKNELKVICGAPNVDKNQKVVFAPVGTIIPKGNFTISKAKIRGIESNGMICSEDELLFSDDHEGIIVLDSKLKPGTKITKALALNDVILEIGITPNRPDALSHIGIARDLAALFNRKLLFPAIKLKESKEKTTSAASIEIKDVVNCPRYTGKVVKNITVKESPAWLKDRIKKIGLRPRNNIVDITNYVMYECGQPLHAFDLDLLKGQKIIVKSTNAESSFTTLDSKDRKLPSGSLMICDSEEPVAIAGVMGGENSEIKDNTKNILIESAFFNSSSIRRTSKTLGLGTDASYRFERGTDPNNTLYAAERTAQLISELAGGDVLSGSIDVYPNKIKNKNIKIRFERIEKVLGYHISSKSATSILKKLGMKITATSTKAVSVSVPTYRPDIEREIDLIEEIARIYGYDSIPTVSKISITLGEKGDESFFTDKAREIACSMGFYEMINNPLQPLHQAALTGKPIKIMNPLSLDMEFLRTSLIPGALTVISQNIKYGEKDVQLFEIGDVFNKKTPNDIMNFEDFVESQNLVFIISGKIRLKGWDQSEKNADFYTLKGMLQTFERKILLDNVLNDSYYHSENCCFDWLFTKNDGKSEIGRGGRIKKDVLKQFDIQQDVFCFEYLMDKLKKIKTEKRKYSEPLKYPKVIRDFAFIFENSVQYDEVEKYIKKEGSELLGSVKLFDQFENELIGKGKKSLAFSLEYYSEERTLTEDEVEREFTRLIKSVTNKFNAKLRGN
jgi:phenylalanyl-tRNA synthetase beta chain